MSKQSDKSRELSAEDKHLKCSASEALNAESQNPRTNGADRALPYLRLKGQ